MTPEQIIETLAQKLGPMAEVAWAAYLKQVYVNVFGGALWMMVFFGAALVCWRLAHKYQGIKDSTDRELAIVAAYIGVVTCLLLAFCAFVFDVLKILNPEYHAIQMLLGR